MSKKLPNIECKVIPHKKQKYETPGNYWVNKSGRHYRISDTGDADHAFLIFIHELIEHHLCEKRGIKVADITAFDKAFEAKRKPGNTDEPGFDQKAPYREEHKFATQIENMIAHELGVSWTKYDRAVESLNKKSKK